MDFFIDEAIKNQSDDIQGIPVISPEQEACILAPLLIITTLSYFVVIERLEESRITVSEVLIPPVELIYKN